MTTGYDEEEEYLRTGNFPIPNPGPYAGYGTRALGDPTLRKFLHSQQREGGEEAFQRQQATFNQEDRRQQPPPQPDPQPYLSQPFSQSKSQIVFDLDKTRQQKQKARIKRQQPEDRGYSSHPYSKQIQQMQSDAGPFNYPNMFMNLAPPTLYGSQAPYSPSTGLGTNLPSGSMTDQWGRVVPPEMRAWSPAQTGRWSQRLSPQQVRVRNEADQEMFDTPPPGSQTMPSAKFSQLNPWMSPTFDIKPTENPYTAGIFGGKGKIWSRYPQQRQQEEEDLRRLDYLLSQQGFNRQGILKNFLDAMTVTGDGTFRPPPGTDAWINQDVIVDPNTQTPYYTWY